jgi:MinD-like ATPase involved in chromosome partitioning or flagellar assembly
MIKLRTKTGAMFGLDARIALAIFGALSVISGAALYSAIQSAKSEQWRQLAESVVKASEAYLIDTGSYLQNVNAEGLLYASDLIDTSRVSLRGWSGPYLQATRKDSFKFTNNMTEPYINGDIGLRLQKTSNWTSASTEYDEKCGNSNPDCAQWVMLKLTSSDAFNIFNMLDEKIDSSDGENAGKVRYKTAIPSNIYYRGIPAQRP